MFKDVFFYRKICKKKNLLQGHVQLLVLTILLLSSNTIAYQALNIDLTKFFYVKKNIPKHYCLTKLQTDIPQVIKHHSQITPQKNLVKTAPMVSMVTSTTTLAPKSATMITKTSSYEKSLVSNKPIQLPTITGPLGLTPTTQSGPNPGPVSASSSTKGIVLLQISRDMVYDPRKIDFASLSLPSTNKSSIKQK